MKFIRLTKILINPSTIRTISMTDTAYTIHFTSEQMNGMMIAGSGLVSSHNSYLVIDKTKQPSDYRMLQCWISKID
jgi:hypothetical protein